MKKNFIIAGLFIAGLYNAQQNGSVGINTKTPSGATLDVQIDKSTGYNKTLGQGVAVPRVTKQELSEMTGTIAEGALVYVNTIGTATGTATARVADVTTTNGVGFYYFDKTKWVKVGGGASSSSTGLTTPILINSSTGKIVEEVTSLTTANWGAEDYMKVLINGYSGTVDLPTPSANKNRMISVQNISGASKNYGANAPKNVGTINTQRAHILISNGTNWYVTGGLGI